MGEAHVMSDEDFRLTGEAVEPSLAARPGTILVWAAPRDQGWCGAGGRQVGCGAQIVWMKTYPKNKPIPLDGVPKPIVCTTEPGGRRQVWAISTSAVHWSTCPMHEQFRGRP